MAHAARALLLIAVGGCGSRAAPVVDEPPTADVTVAWAGTASIYDVLGRDPTLIQAVEVPPRALPDGVTVHPAVAGYRVVTLCGPGYCVDGLHFDDRPLVAAALSPDDREILGAGDGSWIERGIAITRADGPWVSFLQAQADFSDGAAHSHGQVACHTRAADGRELRLSEYVPHGARAGVDAAVATFFAEQPDRDVDPRAAGPEAAATTDFMITGPDSVVLCIPADWQQEEVLLVKVTLRAPA